MSRHIPNEQLISSNTLWEVPIVLNPVPPPSLTSFPLSRRLCLSLVPVSLTFVGLISFLILSAAAYLYIWELDYMSTISLCWVKSIILQKKRGEEEGPQGSRVKTLCQFSAGLLKEDVRVERRTEGSTLWMLHSPLLLWQFHMRREAEGVNRVGSFLTMTTTIASISSTQSQQFLLPRFLHGHGAPTSPSQQSMSKNLLSRKMSPFLKVGKVSDSMLCREGGHSWLQTRRSQIARNKCKATNMAGGVESEESRKGGELKEGDVQTVVIVGAGLSGLATALALHRVGVKALVLEQSGALRTEGTSLTLFPNAWRALNALGVADEIRGSFLNLTGARMRTSEGKTIQSYKNSDCPGGPHEMRPVERKSLLEVLAQPLPSDAIKFNSRVKNINKPQGARKYTELELDDGTTIRTKVLVGCDGARSVVASSIGIAEPQSVGQLAIRGLAEFKSGHNFEPIADQIIGKGVRAGIAPVSKTKVYWFVLFKDSPSVSSKITDPQKVKEEALGYMRNWPSDIQECINMTPLECLNRSTLKDRWSIPLVTPQQTSLGITLVGDAAHPMTPNLAQGGCTALEDSIVLTRKLVEALRSISSSSSNNGSNSEHIFSELDKERIGSALTEYESERWARTFQLTLKSYVFGALLAFDNSLICFVRNNIALPIAFRASVVLGSSKYDCGTLPPPL